MLAVFKHSLYCFLIIVFNFLFTLLSIQKKGKNKQANEHASVIMDKTFIWQKLQMRCE